MIEQKSTAHPKGLSVLFVTEMWERFNFYGMRALLTLFLVNALAFSKSNASVLYGGFLGLSYLMPMLGGFVSDRYLGNRSCILFGGLTMALGQLLLFFSASVYAGNLSLATTLMWISLGVLIVGNGFFKPNISSMVGQLYAKGDNRLDSAFTIFYMGINVGAFLGMTICPLLGDIVLEDGTRVVSAFRWGFLAAGIAMLLGTIIFFFLKNKYIVTPDGRAVGAKPNAADSVDSNETGETKFSRPSQLLAAIGFVVLVVVFHLLSKGGEANWVKEWVYPIIYAAGLTLAGLIISDKSLTKVERDRIIVMYFVAFFVIFFWACFEQAGSSLTFIADNQTDRRLFGWNMPPSFIQNANSLFIIIFAIPFSLLWTFLGKRGMEPISPVKQSIGLGLLAIGFLIIAFQVRGLSETGKMGVIWLIIMYLFHTWGELCLSPIGLSLVSKLAPKKFSSLLMGVWFLASAAGYAFAGTLGSVLPPTGEQYQAAQEAGIDLKGVLTGATEKTESVISKLNELRIPIDYPKFAGFTIHNLFEFFLLFVILPGAAALLLFIISPMLKRMMHGVR
jgi:POT family proton-dependent oligopeptide transporter